MTQEQYQKAEAIQKQLQSLEKASRQLVCVYDIDIKLIERSTKFELNKLFEEGLGKLFNVKLKEFKKALEDAIEAKTAELQQEFEKL